MATRPEPILIQYFPTGLITNRQPLFHSLKNIGIQVVSLSDTLLDGVNVEVTDWLTLKRRPPFTKYCTQQLAAGELVNQFYSVKNLLGVVTPLVDTNQNLYSMTPIALTSLLTKSTTAQGFPLIVANTIYYADGIDFVKFDSNFIQSGWGTAAPTVAPVLTNTGNFWAAQTVFPASSAIVDPNGNVELLTLGGGGHSGVIEPQWLITLGSITQDGSLSWLNVGSIGSWQPSTAYNTKFAVILDTNGNLQQVTTTGTSGTTPPTWSTGLGITTTDSTVTWTNWGNGSSLAFSNYFWVYGYRTIYGHLSTASPVSANSGPIIGPQTVTISSWAITGNVITFTGAHNFVIGDMFEVQGLTNGTFLNGQKFRVTAVTFTTPATNDTFSANITNPNVAATPDSGYTTNAVGLLQGVGTTDPFCTASALVTNVSATNDVVTCTGSFQLGNGTNVTPGLGIWITLVFSNPNAGAGPFLNNQQVQITSATATQFTFTFNMPDYPSQSDSATATFDAVEIYRTDDGGGIPYFDGAIPNPVLSSYTSGAVLAGAGVDDLTPGANQWADPEDVSDQTTDYANVAVPNGSGAQNFSVVRSATAVAQFAAGSPTNRLKDSGAGADSGGGGQVWVTPNNISVTGQTTNSFLNIGSSSNFLNATSFGFAVPTGSTITGIFAQITKGVSAIGSSAIIDNGVFLLKAGSRVGSDHSLGGTWNTSTFRTDSYGSSSDLWGTTWAAADINSGNFGLAIRAHNNSATNSQDAFVQAFIVLTVYYTPPNGAPVSCTAVLSSVTAGHYILVGTLSADGNSVASPPTDSFNTYSALHALQVNLNTYIALVTTGGNLSITQNFNGTQGGQIVVAEVTGMQNVQDVSAVNSATVFGTFNSGAVTTTNATDILLSFVTGEGTAPSGNPTPSLTALSGTPINGVGSIQANNTGYSVGMSYQQVSSAAAYNSNWSITNANDNSDIHLNGVTIALKAVVAGTSDGLNASTFPFSVPLGTKVQNIQVSFAGFTTATTTTASSFTVQLMRNGLVAGNSQVVATPTSAPPGGTTNITINGGLWGAQWLFSNFNNSRFGVKITANNLDTVNHTFNVNDVLITVSGQTDIWSFTDTTTDSNLVTELIAPQGHLNDPPPGTPGSIVQGAGTIVAFWNDRIWMAVGNKVYFSAGPDAFNGIPEECWPPAYFFSFPGPVTGLRVITGGVLVTTSDSWWTIQGGPQTVAFYPDQAVSHFGNLTPNSLSQDGDTIYVYTSTGQCFAVAQGAKNEVGWSIGNLFANGQSTSIVSAAAFSPSLSSITLHRNGYDSGLLISNGIESIMRYGLNVNNWSTIYQPAIGASGVVNAGVIQSVETTPGIWTCLLASTVSHDYIYQRNFTPISYVDNGNAYDASAIIGNIRMSEMGTTLVPLKMISIYGANTLNVPAVSFLPNEIFASTALRTAFTALPIVQNEPALLPLSKSIMAVRFPVMANQVATPLMLRHVQVKLDWGLNTTADELFELALNKEVDQLS